MASKSTTLSADALQLLERQIAECHIKRRWLPLHPQASSPPPSRSIPLTILSYNLLAQSLIRRAFIPYASKPALRLSHRLKNLTAEILSLSPDIIALQECDTDLYHSHYTSVLKHWGYTSVFACRERGRHGCAIFWKEDRLQQVSYEALQFDDIADEYPNDPNVQAEMRKGNVAQVLALRIITSDANVDCGVLISNTHLQWNPLHRFARLKQCERLLSTMHNTHTTLLPIHFHRVFAGDWNITPVTSVYHYLITGSIDSSLWYKFAPPKPSPASEEIDGLSEGSKPSDELPDAEEKEKEETDEAFHSRMTEVREMLRRRVEWPLLHSVYSQYTDVVPEDIKESVMESGKKEWSGWTGEPPFTHFVDRYRGTLDYIMVTDEGEKEGASRLEAVSLLEIPTEEEVSKQTALPNDIFSSDHLCIGCKFLLHLR